MRREKKKGPSFSYRERSRRLFPSLSSEEQCAKGKNGCHIFHLQETKGKGGVLHLLRKRRWTSPVPNECLNHLRSPFPLRGGERYLLTGKIELSTLKGGKKTG